MKIVWEWSLQSEAERLTEMSLKVANGFYHLHHFLPLSFNPVHTSTTASHHVYLPDLPYNSISRYWETVSKISDSYPLKHLPKISLALITHLATLNLTPLTSIGMQSTAHTYLPQVIRWLKHTFPQLPLPQKILIHPSYFGTSGSFHFDQKQGVVILYLRYDQELFSLVEILLTALLRPHAGDTLYTDWEKTEYLVDYLLLESSLKSLLPPPINWTPTTIPPHFTQELLNESDLFLKKMGAPINRSAHFCVKDNVIYFANTPLTSMTAKETKILISLISHAPAPLSTDELADLIFTSDDKFSLAALTKTIERLRTKLNTLGISSSYIATASGIGYYLKN